MVASAPASAVSAIATVTSKASMPPEAAFRPASTAGISASSIVFSPGSAFPSCWIPAIAASSAATITSPEPESGDESATALPARINPVPYSGPAAPPTVLISVRPAVFSRAPATARGSSPSGRPASTSARIALKPRSMFVPWSPSPMAWSSAVSAAACSWRRSAARRSQASMTSIMDRYLDSGGRALSLVM